MSYSRAWAFLGLKSVLLYRWSHTRIFPKKYIWGSRTIIKSMETHRYGPSRRCVLSTGCFNVFWLSSLNIDKEPFEVRPSTKPQALRVPGRTSKVGIQEFRKLLDFRFTFNLVIWISRHPIFFEKRYFFLKLEEKMQWLTCHKKILTQKPWIPSHLQ